MFNRQLWKGCEVKSQVVEKEPSGGMQAFRQRATGRWEKTL
jgi:hypothetical protein